MVTLGWTLGQNILNLFSKLRNTDEELCNVNSMKLHIHAHCCKLSLNNITLDSRADNSANLRSYVIYTAQQEREKLIKLKHFALLQKSINSAFKTNVFSSAMCGLSPLGRMFHHVIYRITPQINPRDTADRKKGK